MTKARDLAGFASSSVTTTASDGLVLKGDGSSTDVVIKNGANATVATVADGTTTLAATANLTAGGSITATGASVGALARGSIQVGNSSGVAAALAKGAAGTVLTSDGTDLSYAAVATGETITFPSDWSSPSATYTSSGTWSKGGLADDAYVWLYLLGGGGGGSMREYSNGTGVAQGGNGGGAFLLYGQAGVLNGTAYTIAAAKAGRTSSDSGQRYAIIPGNVSTFTLPSSIGGTVYTTGLGYSDSTPSYVKLVSTESVVDIIPLSAASDDFVLFNTPPYEFTDLGKPSGIRAVYGLGEKAYSGGTDAAEACIFGSGNGGRILSNGTVGLPGSSQFAAAGGSAASTGNDGVSPGGGGGGATSGSGNGGAGAAGNLRQYNV